MLREAIAIRNRAHASQGVDNAHSLFNLAAILERKGDIDDAEATIRQAVEAGRPQSVQDDEDDDEDATDNSQVLHLLSGVLAGQADRLAKKGDLAGARRLLWERLSLEIEVHGDRDWHVTSARVKWEDADGRARLDPEQRRLVEESDRLIERAKQCATAKDTKAGIEAAAEALRLREAALAEQHECAEALSWLGFLYTAAGDHRRAVEATERGAEITRRCLGSDHPRYASTLVNLARCHLNGDDDEAAEPSARSALAISRATVGAADETYLEAHDTLVAALRKKAKRAEGRSDIGAARQALSEAIKLTEDRYGAGDASAADRAALSKLKSR